MTFHGGGGKKFGLPKTNENMSFHTNNLSVCTNFNRKPLFVFQIVGEEPRPTLLIIIIFYFRQWSIWVKIYIYMYNKIQIKGMNK